MSKSSDDEIRNIVVNLLVKIFHDDRDVILSRKTNDEWDSLKQLQISLEIEDQFGIELSDEQSTDFYDVESILTLIHGMLDDAS